MFIDEKILSIDFDDDDKDMKSFTSYIQNYTEKEKIKIANDFEFLANNLLFELEEKKKNNEIQKIKLIQYILKHTKNKYSIQELNSYDYYDIKNIYNEIKKNRNIFQKLFRFMFNL